MKDRKLRRGAAVALVLLGLNATLTLALSFSLVKVLRSSKASGLDLPYYWRRTMLAGSAGPTSGQPLATMATMVSKSCSNFTGGGGATRRIFSLISLFRLASS